MEEIFFETCLDKTYENNPEFNTKIWLSPCDNFPTLREIKEGIKTFGGLQYDIVSIFNLKEYLEKTNHVLYDIQFNLLSEEHKEYLIQEGIKITNAKKFKI